VFAWQQLENLELNWRYLPLLLFLFFPFCAKPLHLGLKRFRLDLKIAKLRFQTRYLRFRVAYNRALLKRLHHIADGDKLAFNMRRKEDAQFEAAFAELEA
jgi:hypothetical protein